MLFLHKAISHFRETITNYPGMKFKKNIPFSIHYDKVPGNPGTFWLPHLHSGF